MAKESNYTSGLYKISSDKDDYSTAVAKAHKATEGKK